MRDRFFDKLDYLECPETYEQPPKLKTLRAWRKGSPKGRFGLVASKLLNECADGPESSQALADLRQQIDALAAGLVVFRSSPSLSRSATDRLRQFFNENAGPDQLGNVVRVWEPGELWELEPAQKLAQELGLILCIDPLAKGAIGAESTGPVDAVDPEQPIYMRMRGLGRARARFRADELEDLADIVQGFPRAWVVFANEGKNRDASALRKQLAASR